VEGDEPFQNARIAAIEQFLVSKFPGEFIPVEAAEETPIEPGSNVEEPGEEPQEGYAPMP
jgi:hypothetical protein